MNDGTTTRRELLRGAAAWATAGALSAHSLADPLRRGAGASDLGTLLGAGLVKLGLEERNVFCLVDLDERASAEGLIGLDFYGHGMAVDPRDPNRVLVFAKHGAGACELDLGQRAVVRPVTTSAEREFYGHGAFSPDGSLLYTTESVLADAYRGVIVVRDGQTLAELGEFPTYGAAPHDCVLRDGGATLVVTNGGGRRDADGAPCVTYVDVPTEKLIERVDMGSPDVNAGHLAVTSAGDLVVVSAARGGLLRDGLGAVSFRRRGGRLVMADGPAEVLGRMRGESLSVAVHEPSGVVGVTNPFGALVTFWDLATGAFVRALDLSWPRGIALSLDGSRFVISYGRSASVLEVASDTLEPLFGTRRSGLHTFSSHVLVHRV